MPRVIKAFGEEVRKRLVAKGWSFRRATISTEIPHTTIGAMADGVIPGEDHIIKWAKALKEPINEWLTLAGYDPIPEELISERPDPMLVREQMAEYLVETGRLSAEQAKEVLSELKAEPDAEEWQDQKSA